MKTEIPAMPTDDNVKAHAQRAKKLLEELLKYYDKLARLSVRGQSMRNASQAAHSSVNKIIAYLDSPSVILGPKMDAGRAVEVIRQLGQTFGFAAVIRTPDDASRQFEEVSDLIDAHLNAWTNRRDCRREVGSPEHRIADLELELARAKLDLKLLQLTGGSHV